MEASASTQGPSPISPFAFVTVVHAYKSTLTLLVVVNDSTKDGCRFLIWTPSEYDEATIRKDKDGKNGGFGPIDRPVMRNVLKLAPAAIKEASAVERDIADAEGNLSPHRSPSGGKLIDLVGMTIELHPDAVFTAAADEDCLPWNVE